MSGTHPVPGLPPTRVLLQSGTGGGEAAPLPPLHPAMGPLALRVTGTCILTCTMIATRTGGCRAEHVPRACASCDDQQLSCQQHGGRRRAQHVRIARANCCTRRNTASVRRTPYRPAPPPSAKGATWASICLHRSVPEADQIPLWKTVQRRTAAGPPSLSAGRAGRAGAAARLPGRRGCTARRRRP